MLRSILSRLLSPGPSQIADGSTPADPSLRRLPLLIWGDVFPGGGRPQVRRVLAGADAHEGMYTWVYLSELLAVRDLLAAKMPAAATALDRFEALRAVVPDPQWQILSAFELETDIYDHVHLRSVDTIIASTGAPNLGLHTSSVQAALGGGVQIPDAVAAWEVRKSV